MPTKPPFPPSSLYQQPSHHSFLYLSISSQATIPSIISLSATLPPFPPSSLYQQPSHHSLHHLFISNPATVPSPFGEGQRGAFG